MIAFMLRRCIVLSFMVLIVALTACAPLTPTVMVTPTPVVTPSPTLTPSPTPTQTPIPPLVSDILWPESVSALVPVPIEVDLVPPPGISAAAMVTATVVDPEGRALADFELSSLDGVHYAAAMPLLLPLEPLEGTWTLSVGVQSDLDVEGETQLVFTPDPISFRDLSGDLPPGVSLRVPEAFTEITAKGNSVAGGRTWRYEGGEIALWWAPGPTEPFLLNNAIVMLETTYALEEMPLAFEVEDALWQDRTAFLFLEEWPEEQGRAAKAWVLQDANYWLYVLRVKGAGGDTIPQILSQTAETFAFVEGQ